MDNWFPIGKHVDFHLIYPPVVGDSEVARSPAFTVTAVVESRGYRVFLTGTRCRD